MRFFLACVTAMLLTACAAPPKPLSTAELPSWSGRLSIKIEATNAQSAQHISASFSLQGSAERGQLDLFTPIGGKAAELTWQKESATLTTSDSKKIYPDLKTAIQTLTGADIPIPHLFGWLQGKQDKTLETEHGWKADLTMRSDGRITASRDWPDPRIDLRVVLE